MKKLSCTIVKWLIFNEYIRSDQESIYVYGLYQAMLTLIHFVTTISIGIFFGMLEESILFLLVFIPLRKFSGGYHATTEWRCYLLSAGIEIISLIIIGANELKIQQVLALFFISSVIIAMFSPIGTFNKPIDSSECKVYKKYVYYLLGIHWGIVYLLFYFNKYTTLWIIVVADVLLALLLIMGKYSNLRRTPKKEVRGA